MAAMKYLRDKEAKVFCLRCKGEKRAKERKRAEIEKFHTNEVFALRTAAIGIGSNSLRMLIADISDGRLKRLKRYREGMRVFAALDAQGNITQSMIQTACQSVEGFRREAVAQGAQEVFLFATSAVRDARNQEAFIKALKDATGLELDVCSGEIEARLSFIGATEGACAGMIDIGGGSTEIAVGCGAAIEQAVSLQMGAVRLYRMHPIESVEDAYRVVEIASGILSPERERFLSFKADRWVGVGGTFTASAALVQRVPWEVRDHIHGFVLTQESVAKTMEQLAPMSIEERLAIPYLQPQRADIAVHGIAILLSLMKGLDIASISVSEYGNLEGYVKMKHGLAGETTGTCL